MNEITKKIIKAYGICAGAGAALFGTFYALDCFESKMTDKRRLERELEESERLRKRAEERLSDEEAQNTSLDRQLRELRYSQIRLQNDLNVAEAKARAKAPVEKEEKETSGRYPWNPETTE